MTDMPRNLTFGAFFVVNERVGRYDQHWVWDAFSEETEAVAEAQRLQDGTERSDSPHYLMSVKTGFHGRPRTEEEFVVRFRRAGRERVVWRRTVQPKGGE
jgi:hypothetical protein